MMIRNLVSDKEFLSRFIKKYVCFFVVNKTITKKTEMKLANNSNKPFKSLFGVPS